MADALAAFAEREPGPSTCRARRCRGAGRFGRRTGGEFDSEDVRESGAWLSSSGWIVIVAARLRVASGVGFLCERGGRGRPSFLLGQGWVPSPATDNVSRSRILLGAAEF